MFGTIQWDWEMLHNLRENAPQVNQTMGRKEGNSGMCGGRHRYTLQEGVIKSCTRSCLPGRNTGWMQKSLLSMKVL